ncbi:site-specific integrase [Bacillus sp. FSL W7-1321]
MGTFRQLKSGKWQARVYIEGQYESIGTFRTKKEAEIEAGKVEERLYFGQTLNDRQILFREIATEWIEVHKKNELDESTYPNYKSVLENHIIPFFGNRRLMNIKRIDIKKWLADYANQEKEDGTPKYSYGSMLRYLSIIKQVFHYAVNDREVLEKDPSLRLRVPVKRNKETQKKATKYLSLDEQNRLLDFMETYRHQRFPEYKLYYILIYFMLQTGLRISEALAVRWNDINANILTVERQTKRNSNNKVVLASLKTNSSYREIRLDNKLLEELRTFRNIQNDCFNKYSSFIQNRDGIIFQNYQGKYLTPSIVREMFSKYSAAAGVPYKGTHGFRHTHAVLLLESGASIKYVSKRLGHKSIKVTADTYLDVTKKIEEDELEKFALYTKR